MQPTRIQSGAWRAQPFPTEKLSLHAQSPLPLCWHLCLGAGDPSTHPAGLSPSCLHPVSPKISKGTSWRICRRRYFGSAKD